MRAARTTFESLELRCLFSGGSGFPDTTFGSGGKTYIDSPAIPGKLLDSLRAPDGSLYYLSSVATYSGSGERQLEFVPDAVSVTKITSSGVIDTSWGTEGRYTFTLFYGGGSSGAMELQSDGMLYLAIGTGGSASNIIFTRVTTNGTIDYSFGNTNGYFLKDAALDFGEGTILDGEQVRDLKLVGTDKAVALIEDTNTQTWRAIKFDRETITPDATFSGDGSALLDNEVGASFEPSGPLYVDSSGRVYFTVNGISTKGPARLTASGVLDSSFNGSGSIDYPDAVGPASVLEVGSSLYIVYPQGTGSVASGISVRKVAIADGTPDSNFGGSGMDTVSGANATDVVVSPANNGDVIVTATVDDMSTTRGLLVARYIATGRDSSFGSGGNLTLLIPLFKSLSGLIRPDDSVIVVADSESASISLPVQLYAFDPSGNVDTTFNPTGSSPGILTVDEMAGGIGEIQTILPKSSGGYLALMAEVPPLFPASGHADAYALNFDANGALISKVMLNVFSAGNSTHFAPGYSKLLPLADGSFLGVFAGTLATEIGYVKFQADGTVDTTYGNSGSTGITLPSGAAVSSVSIVDALYDVTTGHVLLYGKDRGSSSTAFIVATNLGGVVDASFGSGGLVALVNILPGSLSRLDAAGAIVATGARDNGNGGTTLVVRAFDSGGNPLGSFGAAGEISTDFGLGTAALLTPYTSFLTSNGTIAIGGEAITFDTNLAPKYRFFVYLIDNTGLAAPGFGTSGVTLSPQESATSSAAYDVTEDPNGGFLVVGTVEGAGLLARLNPDGSLDSSFGANIGTGSTSFYDRFTTITVDSMGRPIVGGGESIFGKSQRSATVGRYLASASTTPPTAILSTPPSTPAANATSVTFVVTYSPKDGKTLNTSFLSQGDILVTLPDSSTGVLQFVSFAFSGTDVLATYELMAPSGGFASGNYTFAVNANEVYDSAGIAVLATSLGNVSLGNQNAGPVSITSIDVTPTQIKPGGSVMFSVTIANSSAIAVPSFSVLVSIQPADGSATYSIGSFPVSGLNAGGTTTVAAPPGLLLPGQSVLTPGTYKIRVTLSSPFVSSLDSDPVLTVIAPPPPVVGGLDPSFGGGSGEVVQFLPGSTITTTVSRNLGNGVLLSAGFNEAGNLVLFRTLSDGTLDTTFGNESTGRVVVDLRGTFDVATGLTLDGTGRILISGYSVDPSGGGSTAFLARFSADGVQDSTFGNSGVALLAPSAIAGNVTTPRVLVIDASGNLYLVGVTRPASGTAADNTALVIRTNGDGVIDEGYGTGGASLPVSTNPSAFNTAILLSTGQLLAGGSVSNGDGTTRMLIVKLNTNGSVDTKFTKKAFYKSAPGSSEQVTTFTPLPGTLKPKGAIYVGGTRSDTAGNSSQGLVLRIASTGAIDKGFGKGVIAIPISGANLATVNSIVIQAEGRVLISLTTANSASSFQAGRFGVTVVRRDAKGVVDPFFNGGQPLTLSAIPVEPTAAQPVVGAFEDFATTRQGQANSIESGAVRTIATRPATGGGTEVRISGIVADAVDLSAVLTVKKLPNQIAPGFKGTTVLLLSNTGSLTSKGAFSVKLIARPVGGGADVELKGLNNSKSLKPGTTLKLTLPANFAKTFTQGNYTILTLVTPTFTELSTANNQSALNSPITVGTPAASRIGLWFGRTPIDGEDPLFDPNRSETDSPSALF